MKKMNLNIGMNPGLIRLVFGLYFYLCDLDNDEIEEIKYYKRLFKIISNELEDIDI